MVTSDIMNENHNTLHSENITEKSATSDHEHHAHDYSSIDSTEKLIALLEHMLHHNESHTDELSGIVTALRKNDKNEAAEVVESAISEYSKGNAFLEIALSMLQ